MAKLLFRLTHAPEEEALAITDLLDEHDIEYYRTEAGRWHLGVAALWVRDDAQYEQARALVDEYEQERYDSLNEERNQLNQLSFLQGLWIRLQEDPKGFSINLLAMLEVLGLFFAGSLYPFL